MNDEAAQHFADESQSESEHWRSIVLFGRNVATYKFSLAKALIEVSSHEKELVLLEDLAVPFARNICEHIANVDRQSTSAHSAFLNACRFFNAGKITEDELRDTTVLIGFNNVISAFHVVGPGDVPTSFFVDERSGSGGIRLTEPMFALAASTQADDLLLETEARWRLVEETWQTKAGGSELTLNYDVDNEILVAALKGKQSPITEIRPALNGYQKGHCFYCFAPVGLSKAHVQPDVDHFLPRSLMTSGYPLQLHSPWNLVLACPTCNRGAAGKFAHLPHVKYLDRLHKRNEFLIGSNHPLRESLILATGATAKGRRKFLGEALQIASTLTSSNSGWTAAQEGKALF